jgi:putative transposase
MLVGPIRDRFKQIIERVAKKHGWQIGELALQPDHVHLFIQTNPYTMPTDIVRLIKGRGVPGVREEYPHWKRMPFLWTHSIFYSTARFGNQNTTKRYIERQGKSEC